LRTATKKQQMPTRTWRQEGSLSHTAGRNANYGNSSEILQNTKHKTIIWGRNPTAEYTQRDRKPCIVEMPSSHVYGSSIHNSQERHPSTMNG
jgi:hypothetical protein